MSVIIKRNDIIPTIIFIIKMTQNLNEKTMSGVLTSKRDFIGGIFDRFINKITETIVFDKIIIPKIGSQKDVKAIGDYYLYKPKKAKIAPDLFGLKINGKIIPFTNFDDGWEAIPKMPQVEVKTFKQIDQMVSLRNQDYNGKYLVLTNLNLHIDYLVSLLNVNELNSYLDETIMDDKSFIRKDDEKLISKITKINNLDEIGSLDLLSITTADDFMNYSTHCGPKISIRRIKSIKAKNSKHIKEISTIDCLKNYVYKKAETGLFSYSTK